MPAAWMASGANVGIVFEKGGKYQGNPRQVIGCTRCLFRLGRHSQMNSILSTSPKKVLLSGDSA